MSDQTLLVSTIIPTRNRAALLTAAIESALSQQLAGGHEIIVVDDSSTDNTAEVVASYPEVRYLHVASGKPSRTRNAGIRAATGRYIAFLDDDDVWLPNRLAPAVKLLDADPSLGLVYGQATMVSHDLTEQINNFPPLPLAEGHPVAGFLDVVVIMDTALIPRAVFDSIGLFDESVFGAEDMDLTVRIARKYSVAAIQHPLALVRLRDPGATNEVVGATAQWLSRADDEFGLLRIHCAIKDDYSPTPKHAALITRRRKGWYTHMLLQTAQTALNAGNRYEARAAFFAALKMSPLHAARNPLTLKTAFKIL